jgi:hypothetical protein
MEATYAELHGRLGKTASEYYSPTYRRLRWKCGCTAAGLTSLNLVWQPCLRHRREAALEYWQHAWR